MPALRRDRLRIVTRLHIQAALAALLLLATLSPLRAEPQQVAVGIWLQNVNDIDMKASLVTMDFYIWFRWKGPIDPTASFEFTNVVEKWGMTREAIYPEPVVLADGNRYQCFHVQGKFNRKFDLRAYPLDRQDLPVEVEDSRHMIGELVYVADREASGYAPDIALPGWDIEGGKCHAGDLTYATTFGRPQAPGGSERYARFTYTLAISRPWAAYLIRMLVPMLVVLLSSFVSFYLSPAYMDARIGIAITALLSSVALHLTVSADLPHVGYVRLIDKIYNFAYVIIFLTLVESAWVVRLRDAGQEDRASRVDRMSSAVLGTISTAGLFWLIALR